MTEIRNLPRARHLLIVDDDDRIRELLKEYLARAGFRVTAASGGAPARKLMESLDFDLAVFDVMMPGEDGFSLTRWLRDQRGPSGRTPVLMLTARGLAEDRIEAILRRAQDRAAPAGEPLKLGRCAFDADRGELACEGEIVRLTEAEVALLRQLARTPHEPVDRLELARGSVDPSGRAVDVQVTRLRRKIEADHKSPRYLRTVRGVGYMLAPD